MVDLCLEFSGSDQCVGYFCNIRKELQCDMKMLDFSGQPQNHQVY